MTTLGVNCDSDSMVLLVVSFTLKYLLSKHNK